MRLSRGLSHGFDRGVLNDMAQEGIDESQRLNELGEQYVADAAVLQQKLVEIKNNPMISEKNKLVLERDLVKEMQRVQQQYENAVVAEQQKLSEEMQETTDDMQTAANELGQEAAELEGIRTSVSDISMSDAANAASAEQAAFEQMKQTYLDRINGKLEEMERQRQKMNNLTSDF